MKRIFAILTLLYFIGISAVCAAPPSGQQQSQTIASSDTTVTLNSTYQHVRVWSSVGASNVWVSFNNATATVAGATMVRIDGGAGYTRDRAEGISSFHYIGDGTTGYLSVDAY